MLQQLSGAYPDLIIDFYTNRYIKSIHILFGQQQANDIQMISFESTICIKITCNSNKKQYHFS